ncbi:MAG: polar amino acid transport system substrate-binding protein [Solirubrobacteraceae bacterium]
MRAHRTRRALQAQADGWRGTRPLVVLLTGVVVAAGALTACGSSGKAVSGDSSTTSADPLAKYQKNGVTLAISNFPPYSKPDPSGTPSGYAPEVALAILKKLHITKVKTRTAQFDAMIPGLQAGQWDMVAGGLTQTPERCQQVLFANPDWVTPTGLLVKEGNPKGVTTATDLVGRDAKAAVPPGTAEMSYVTKAKVAKSQIVSVPDLQAGIAALKAGRADVAFADVESLKTMAPAGFEAIKDSKRPAIGTGYAFKPSDKAFRDAFDRGLAQAVADGTIARIAKKTKMYGIDPAVIARTTRKDLNPGTPACLR